MVETIYERNSYCYVVILLFFYVGHVVYILSTVFIITDVLFVYCRCGV
jgi:hypothetical protein